MDFNFKEEDEHFEKIRENRLLFLKEALMQGEYIVNPKAIAAQWLLGENIERTVDEYAID